MLHWNRTLSATAAEVEAFCLALRGELTGRWLKSDVFAAELVFREVLANALEHGARSDPGQTIGVALDVDQGRLKARVSDAGPGFAAQPSRAPDGAERGRGLEILSVYAQAHAFEDGGRTVAFELTLHPAEGPKE